MNTDDKYIESVKKHYARRKIHAFILIVISFALFIYLLQFSALLNTFQANKSIISSILLEGKKTTKTEIKLIETQFVLLGLVYKNYGIALGASLFAAFNILVYALYLFFGCRKDRLLIKYYEKKNA